MGAVRVVVVDDSATMRGIISANLTKDPEIEVVGTAADPLEAREAIKLLNPDVITLDVEMPNMNGLDFLEKIMRLRPMPVVMISTLTQAGAEISLEALQMGAVDCVGKPNGLSSNSHAFDDLPLRVKTAARARVRKTREGPVVRKTGKTYEFGNHVIAIGSSTGGVEALMRVLSEFPEGCPPTVITQHMPPTFTSSFADRLNRVCGSEVAVATDGAILSRGKVYLAPGGDTHLEVVQSAGIRCRLRTGDLVSGHRPSVDVLFNSVAESVGGKAVGAILTGMGRDGASGLLAMRKTGARTLGEDSSSCVVYGMPKVAHEIGAVERQVPLPDVAPAILQLCSKTK